MNAEIQIRFVSKAQEDFYYCRKRNLCFNSGYGAGKSHIACLKALTLLTTFPGYRFAIGRFTAEELRKTTLQTFFKICPNTLYDSKYGGSRADNRNELTLINGSKVYWMHFKDQDISALKSLEVNSALIDQAEEVNEEIYLALDSRVGRWEDVEVPPRLLADYYRENGKEWPRNEFTGKFIVPGYMMVLINPPDEGELHWSWQRYHPDSEEHQEKFFQTHFYVESTSLENKALNKETLQAMLSREKEWVDRYVLGKFSKGAGAIHSVPKESILHVGQDFIQNLKSKSALYRSYDHGQTAPACCLWFATYDNIHICWQEYYAGGKTISQHRKMIADLSGNDLYKLNIADPEIFKLRNEKYGAFWSTADEYMDRNIDSPPINWIPGDNNELATRNRINEWLLPHKDIKHPLTGEPNSPKLYFIARDENVPQGCHHVIKETRSQKLELLDTINGKPVYSDNRSEGPSDHAYDPLRYYVAQHANKNELMIRKVSDRSFYAAKNRIKALKISGYLDKYGLPTT